VIDGKLMRRVYKDGAIKSRKSIPGEGMRTFI
jgi:hypothetical protein